MADDAKPWRAHLPGFRRVLGYTGVYGSWCPMMAVLALAAGVALLAWGHAGWGAALVLVGVVVWWCEPPPDL